MHPRDATMRRQSGFTLIDVLLVILIIIMVGVLIWKHSGTSEQPCWVG